MGEVTATVRSQSRAMPLSSRLMASMAQRALPPLSTLVRTAGTMAA